MVGYALRGYQQEAIDKTLAYVRKSIKPCIIEAACGAGKSLLAAELAKNIHQASDKNVLCIAPSAELVKQNAAKYLATGNPCSIYSASAGRKELRHPVVFASPLTFAPMAAKVGHKYAAVIVDEAHSLTNTLRKIIDDMRAGNPALRVIGMSATPYRLRDGYVYNIDDHGNQVHPSMAYKPFFHRMTYRITAESLIEQGYLCEERIIHPDNHYDAAGLKVMANGKFKDDEVKRTFESSSRTDEIVNNVVNMARDRKGVFVFAATVRHAHEIMEVLPSHESAIITAKTSRAERESILARYGRQEIKYLVNVSTLTTGVDAPHTDVVALLRATESPSLFLQMIGRGMRLSPGKKDYLLIDAAENILRHDGGKGIYRPSIYHRVRDKDKEATKIKVRCPGCGGWNTFSARENKDGFTSISPDGYFCLDGIKTGVIAHYGQRCESCGYRYEFKECEKCHTANSLSARECSSCGNLFVDPNDKLRADSIIKIKVVEIHLEDTITKAGNPCLTATFVSDAGDKIKVWYAVPYLERRFRAAHKHGIRSLSYAINEAGYPVVYGYN